MLLVTVDTVEGVQFIKDIQVAEPDEIYMGVPVHRVPEEWLEAIRAIKAMGFRKVGVAEYCFQQDLYTQGRFSFLRAKVTHFLFRVYWAAIKWLYDNARVFKQIPAGSPFSWSYFTPYCWYLSLKRKLNAPL